MLSNPLSFGPSQDCHGGSSANPAIVYVQRSDMRQPALPWANVPKAVADNLAGGFVFRVVREPAGELRCTYVSAGVQKILGVSAHALGENLGILNAIVDAVSLQELSVAGQISSRNQSPLLIEVNATPRNGDARKLRVSATPRYLRGGFIEWDGLVLDITDHARAEEAASQRAQALQASNNDLEAYARSVAHNLRSPLHCIDAYLEIIRMRHPSMLEGNCGELLSEVQRAANRMRDTVEGMLELSQLQGGDLDRQTVDLTQIAQTVTAALQRTGCDREVEFHISTGLTAQGDARLLTVVLTNLLENAWKYTSRKSRGRIEVGMTDCQGTRVFHVKDNGAGFDMNQSARLFGAFQRLHSSAEFPGTGLGLSIVRRIIERHGGHVWAAAVPGEGATFYFTV